MVEKEEVLEEEAGDLAEDVHLVGEAEAEEVLVAAEADSAAEAEAAAQVEAADSAEDVHSAVLEAEDTSFL